MKHRHIFVPPFWKYNRFCLFCGRLESLTVGKNTVQLTDNKISFGADTTLNAAKQLGFDTSSRLIYHDGVSVRTVANTFDLVADAVKIASIQTNSVVLQNSNALTTIFEILFTPDFTTYPNGYWVFITPVEIGALIKMTNDYNGDGIATPATLTLQNYCTSTVSAPLYYNFGTGSSSPSITDYIIRLTQVGTSYYISYSCSGKDGYGYDYNAISNSMTQKYSAAHYQQSTTTLPDRIKLTAQWSVVSSETYAYFSKWFVILYGLK